MVAYSLDGCVSWFRPNRLLGEQQILPHTPLQRERWRTEKETYEFRNVKPGQCVELSCRDIGDAWRALRKKTGCLTQIIGIAPGRYLSPSLWII